MRRFTSSRTSGHSRTARTSERKSATSSMFLRYLWSEATITPTINHRIENRLGPRPYLMPLGLPDGAVDKHQDPLTIPGGAVSRVQRDGGYAALQEARLVHEQRLQPGR